MAMRLYITLMCDLYLYLLLVLFPAVFRRDNMRVIHQVGVFVGVYAIWYFRLVV